MRLSQIPDGHVLRFLRFLSRAKTCVSPAFYGVWWPMGAGLRAQDEPRFAPEP